MQTPPSHSRDPRRILVRGVNWLGDAVMTTPALMRLRERFPDAHIAILTPEKLKDLWQHHPAVNETISFAADEGLFSISRKLRVGRFDLALILPNSPRSALAPWLARIPCRIGYSRPWRNWFLTRTVPTRPDAVKMRKRTANEVKQLIERGNAISKPSPSTRVVHQTLDYLHLVGSLGANTSPLPPCLAVTDDEIKGVREKLGIHESIRPIFGLNPGAEYGPAKRWPLDRFITAAREIQKQTNCVWLILGGKNEVETANQIQSAFTAEPSAIHNLAGRTTLRELCAVLKLCRIVLTNDTGPMHVAAALGTPVVVPFGSTSAELTGPGLPGDARHRLIRSDAPCSPCFLRECPIDFRCMKGITVETIVAAAVTLNSDIKAMERGAPM